MAKSNIPRSAILSLILLALPLLAQEIVLKGRVADPQENSLPQALVQLVHHNEVLAQAVSGPDGRFEMKVASAGEFLIKAEYSHGECAREGRMICDLLLYFY